MKESVLLMEPDQSFRVVQLLHPVDLIVENPALGGNGPPITLPQRIWKFHGERTISRHRVFREVEPARPPAEEPERPRFDELTVKIPPRES